MAKAPPKLPESTAELVTRVRGGDRDAADALVDRELPALRQKVHGTLPRIARDICDTDDVVQEAFLRTWRHINRIDVSQPGSFRAYTRRTAKNHVIDRVRQVLRRPVSDELPEVADSKPGPDAQMEEARFRADVRTALDRLTRSERRLITARFNREWSYAAIADKLGKPSADAARVAVHRACKRLLADLDQRARATGKASRRKNPV
ncbi:MAG TPA: sigma-70 family RNA polymerase sigma factor [Vicinamibacterales bacterium]|jgi:RNA polymerase sigma-70 factor (ECF subfamily)